MKLILQDGIAVLLLYWIQKNLTVVNVACVGDGRQIKKKKIRLTDYQMELLLRENYFVMNVYLVTIDGRFNFTE